MTAAFALQLFCTRELLCSIWSYALYFMFFIPLNPGSFEIVITQSTRENAQHCYCEFATLFLFSCSFVSFKPPVTPQKSGKQKRLFTPLLGRRDLEGGSELSTVLLLNELWFTPFRSQLVQVCIFVYVCVASNPIQKIQDADQEIKSIRQIKAAFSTEQLKNKALSYKPTYCWCLYESQGFDTNQLTFVVLDWKLGLWYKPTYCCCLYESPLCFNCCANA